MDLIRPASQGAYILAKVLTEAPLNPKGLYAHVTPHVNSLKNNELFSPPVSLSPQNEAYLNYVSMWDVQSMSSVRIWLQIIATIRDKGRVPLVVFTNWNQFLKIIHQSFPFIKLSNLEIPIVYEAGNSTKFRMVGVTEWIQIKGRRETPYLFCKYILSLSIFGFGTDIGTLKALRLTDTEVMRYIQMRVSGGRIPPFSPPEIPVHSSKRQRLV